MFEGNTINTIKQKISLKKHQNIEWFGWGSNPGPLACEASVITTTLPNRLRKGREMFKLIPSG